MTENANSPVSTASSTRETRPLTIGEAKKEMARFLAYLKKPLQPELVEALEAIRRIDVSSKLGKQLAEAVEASKAAQALLSQTISAKTLLGPERLALLRDMDASIKSAMGRIRELSPVRLPTIDWRAIQARDEAANREAAKRNWFMQPETEAVFLLNVMDTLDNPARFDSHFAAVIRRDLEEIRERLLAAFPKRASVLKEAFLLHREGRYLASVPLMLLSAEGIAWDVTGKSVFTAKAKGKPQVGKWLDKTVPDGYRRALVAGLSTDHPLSVAKDGHLNRHRVLHGRSVDYGTEIFGLQATSFLGAVGWVFAPDGLLAKQVVSPKH